MKRTLITATLALCLFAPAIHAQNRIVFRTPQEAVQYYEELVGTLTKQVKLMQDDNAVLSAATQELKGKVEKLEKDMQDLAAEMASLRKQISADAEARKAQLNKLADKLSTPAPASRTAAPAPQAQNDGTEYVEHTVEAGTTLTALAKAYGVSVADIVKANKLSKHTIFVGQKLLIPVSKKR
ncbi:MAG: putative endopeptidase p60 precursor [Lentisphaerae bacterium ADurb.Bin242]|nr:MAG: putative endopeptidase p60 precursor [Lentisphaerae bacterium ADurb.Bin242]